MNRAKPDDDLDLLVIAIRQEIEGIDIFEIGARVVAEYNGENEARNPQHKIDFGTATASYSCESVGVVIGYCKEKYEPEKLAYIIETSKGTSVVRQRGIKRYPNE